MAEAFVCYRERFLEITNSAGHRFWNDDFQGLRNDAIERLDLYRKSVEETKAAVRSLLKERLRDRSLWPSIKAVYSTLIAEREDWELAETYFNSITRHIFVTHGVDPLIEFVDSDFQLDPAPAPEPIYRTFRGRESLSDTLGDVLDHYDLRCDSHREVCDEIAERLHGRLREAGGLLRVERIEVLDAPFYRGRRLHLVARVFSRLHFVPLVVVARREAGVLRIEAALVHDADVSILFSFTRAHFHVYAPRPMEVVRFLRSILPRKRTAELYNAIGCDRHGKTEFYRDLLSHLQGSDERFAFAPGTPGLVMAAFFLPGYDVVFKVIRDRFRPPKVVSREQVIAKYQFVQRHDRAGRLVEAQDFEYLLFRRARFDDALMRELTESCASSTRVEDDHVVISHLYVERQVVPLNLYLKDADPEAARAAAIDFGQCIKDLAYSEVFPGDLLTKNFGVTRNGRVVFYDYDELIHLGQCNFRHIPPARTPEDELSAEPWYRVGEDDIFPEELRTFIGLNGEWLRAFESEHGELFDADWWCAIQERVRRGEGPEVQPFSHRCLL